MSTATFLSMQSLNECKKPESLHGHASKISSRNWLLQRGGFWHSVAKIGRRCDVNHTFLAKLSISTLSNATLKTVLCDPQRVYFWPPSVLSRGVSHAACGGFENAQDYYVDGCASSSGWMHVLGSERNRGIRHTGTAGS